MRKLILNYLIFSFIISIASFSNQEPKSSDSDVRLHCQGRQIVDGLSNPVHLRGIYARGAKILSENDIVRIKGWGCNFMRITIPFDENYWQTVNGGTFDINLRGILREEDLVQMDRIAGWCENQQIYFMFCQQPTYQGFDFDLLAHFPTDPSLYAEQMAAVATIFSTRYQQYDYLVGYEPFGEPFGVDSIFEYIAYKQIVTAVVDAHRAIEPDRIISVAAADGASPSGLPNSIQIDRDNIIYTFSYYPSRPIVSYRPWYGDLRYPGRIPDFYKSKAIWLDTDFLLNDSGLADAISKSQSWDVPIYCHEFGSWGADWDTVAPCGSSERIMLDTVQIFEDNLINWVIWRWETGATDVPQHWKQLWIGQPNNRVTIEPHGGTFVDSVNITLQSFVEGGEIRYTVDGSTPTETSPLYSDAFELTDSTTVKSRVFHTELSDTPIDTAIFNEGGETAVFSQGALAGLDYKYYEGDWSAIPDLDAMTPVSTGTCSSFDPTLGSNTDGKALLWEGLLNVSDGAVYYFNARVETQGELQLFINDTRVVLCGYSANASSYSVGLIALEEGLHPIRLAYTRPSGAGSLFEIQIQRPSDSGFVDIPSSMLFREINVPPSFLSDPIEKGPAYVGWPYHDSMLSSVTDANSYTRLRFTKTEGPSWLNISRTGVLSGIPEDKNLGLNVFTVHVEDQYGEEDEAVMNLRVDSGTPSGFIYVDASAQGQEDGTNWDDAFTRIENAIQSVISNTTMCPILLAGGIYDISNSLTLVDEVSLYGGWSNNIRDPKQFPSIIMQQEGNSVVILDNVRDTRLDGFQISGGYATAGGGIYCLNLGPSNWIVNCTISNNFALSKGGGICSENSSPFLDCLTIQENQVGNSEDAGFAGGGGLYVDGGCVTLSRCLIRNNNAIPFEMEKKEAGGIYVYRGSVTMTNCILTGNTGHRGGGIALRSSDESSFINCTFSENDAQYWGTNLILTLQNCPFTAINCIFEGGNRSIRWHSSTAPLPAYRATVTNCLFYSFLDGSTPSDVYASGVNFTGNQLNDPYLLNYGTFLGNFRKPNTSPLFKDKENEDFDLAHESAAIDRGINEQNVPVYDFVGRTRPSDGDNNGTEEFDIGAYEYLYKVTYPQWIFY